LIEAFTHPFPPYFEVSMVPEAQATHLAVTVGSDQGVDELTARRRRDGFEVIDGPRRTGDGYYERVILDPDGNLVIFTRSSEYPGYVVA
jgi:hypothetical protein